VVTIAMILKIEKNKVKDIRIAMGSIAPIPLRLFKTEEFLKNKEVNDALIEGAKNKIYDEVNPISDIRASQEYRKYVSGVLFKRAFKKLTN
jgi:carbon-monoxide dehydrogenase medium subunit